MARNDAVKKLTQSQQKGLLALIAGSNQADAAAAAGVSLRTIQRWTALPAFSQALASGIDVTMSIAVSRLSALSDTAIDILQNVMLDPSSTPAHRLRAANTTLDKVLKLAELHNVLGRIDALEDRLNGLQSPLISDSRIEG